ncbi:MAG TPA: helix-turn-helix domain-containing protein [Thermoflexia bacterium]|jgi:excisionase family DNA binding protein|nr:helix-turn-helix domain-containing protein [Thermoflexia bacterium]
MSKRFWWYWGILRRWGWLLMLSVLIPALVAGVLVSRQPDFYRAKATLMVGTSLQTPSPDPWQLTIANNLANAYARLAREGPVTQAVIDQLGLDRSTSQLAAQITTRVYPEAQLLEIQVVDQDPKLAAAIANAIAEELVRRSPVSQEEEHQRREFIKAQLSDLEARIERLNGEIADLQNTLPELTSAAELEEARRRLEQLETLRTNYQSTYANLLDSLQVEAPNALSIFEPAAEPTTPLPRRTGMTVGAATIAGLVLAITGVLVVERLDDSVRWEEVEEGTFLDRPVLGAIPRIRVGRDRLLSTVPLQPDDLEALRHLRTALMMELGERWPVVVLVAGADVKVGRTFITAGLGKALAEAGLRTLLVDGNLRSPALHEWFDQPNLEGLTELLQGQRDLTGAWDLVEGVPTGVDRLHLLPAGRPASDPTVLFVGDRWAALLEELKKGADVVLIDTPAGLTSPEVLLLARRCEGVLVVCGHRRTRSASLSQMLKSLEEHAPRVPAWLAFNRVPRRQLRLHPTPQWAAERAPLAERPTLSVGEAAKVLGVRPAVVRRWCRTGRLQAERVRWRWIIRREDLERLMPPAEVAEIEKAPQTEPAPLS